MDGVLRQKQGIQPGAEQRPGGSTVLTDIERRASRAEEAVARGEHWAKV